MKAPRIDHIGIIVPDLDSAVVTISLLLGGLAPERRDLPEVGLCIAEFETENLRIELIAYDRGSEFARRVMGTEPGINHISVQVEDVSAAVDRLSAAGLRMQDGFPRRGAHGEVAFFERDAATHLLLEICALDSETSKERA
jgi:methylmalonyl-CoA/ethylmalonyl-CoA epimerase